MLDEVRSKWKLYVDNQVFKKEEIKGRVQCEGDP